MLSSLRRFTKDEVAQKRLEIMSFYSQFGETAAKQAFGADRKVISRWKKRLKLSGGKLASLLPYSTRPKTVRRPLTNLKIIEFIEKIRQDHPRIGKDKIKPDLDEYCETLGIKTISVSTIGNVLKRHHFFFQKAGRVYHNPDSKWALKQAKKKPRLRIKHSPKPKEYGHILSDTVERITDGLRDYFISAIDAKLKFALTLNYKRLTARNMKDFYFRFKSVYPATVKAWQSDNGSENLGVFDQQLTDDGISHLFIYPRCPKINTFIERYNRTVQEEFIDYHLDTIHDKPVFNQKLAEWNIYYNAKRRHHSLGLKSPLNYFVDNGGMSQMSLTYTKI
ncbi:MAG: integrase core domain-containing protein [Candidatus Beckwithbacteria bacterium]